MAGALRRLVVAVLVPSLLGCVHPAPAHPVPAQPAPAHPASPQAAAVAESGLDGGLHVVEASGQGLEFPLPDAAGWKRDARERQSWVARHLRSSSQLVVRAWRHDEIARPEDCEQQARLWRKDLPALTTAEQIEHGERLLAGSYRSQVTLGVRSSSREPGRLLGYVLAFGSDARSCLMLAFSTTATGAAARSLIARRLAIVEGTVFQRLRRLDIEGRVTVPRL